MQDFEFRVAIEKASATGEFVSGFAAVATVGGVPVVDDDEDTVEIEELRRAGHEFMAGVRKAKVHHKGNDVGEVVELVTIDDAFAKALGVTDPRRGTWITMQIHSEVVKARVRRGELRNFSIGGKAKRVAA